MCLCSSSPVAAQYVKVPFRVRLLKRYKFEFGERIQNVEMNFWNWGSFKFRMEVNQNSKAMVPGDIMSWNSHLGENHLLQWQHFWSWPLPNTCYPGVGTQCVACIYWAKDPRGPPHHLVSPPEELWEGGQNSPEHEHRKRGVLISGYSVYWVDSTAQWRDAGNKSVTVPTQKQIQLFLPCSRKLWAIPRCFNL